MGKKSFVLRIDEETFKLLEKWAEDEYRSVNGQLDFLINSALLASGRKKKTVINNNDKKEGSDII